MVDENKLRNKIKLLFLLEYLGIGAVLIVIGFLRMFNVISFSSTRLLVYNILTSIGAAYLLFDFVWCLVSKKKREKTCFLDKYLTLVPALYLVAFNIICFAKLYENVAFYQYSVASILLYAGLVAVFLGIYHHYRPTKLVNEAIEEEIQNKLKEQEESKEENKE